MRYVPVGLVGVRAAALPLRVKTSVSPGTGASQGCPATQIGEIGPRVTIPRRPLCVVAAAPEAATSDAIARTGAIRRIDRNCCRFEADANGEGRPEAALATRNGEAVATE